MDKKLKIYLVSRNDRVWYDEYDSAVVVAKNQKDAIDIIKKEYGQDGTWGEKINVTVKEVELNRGVVLGSFNAG